MSKLIDKDDLVAELKKRIQESLYAGGATKGVYLSERMKEDSYILSFVDTLEVKEVDLDFQRFAKEMGNVFALPSSKTKNTEEEPLKWEYEIAKHFFELGIKAAKK